MKLRQQCKCPWPRRPSGALTRRRWPLARSSATPSLPTHSRCS